MLWCQMISKCCECCVADKGRVHGKTLLNSFSALPNNLGIWHVPKAYPPRPHFIEIGHPSVGGQTFFSSAKEVAHTGLVAHTGI